MSKSALCVRRDELMAAVKMPVALYYDDVDADVLNQLQTYEFRSRPECETNFDWKQIIPYVVVRVPTEQQLVLAYYRSVSAGESRLHGQRSIGLGGHIEPDDLDLDSPRPFVERIKAAAMRELIEEGVPAHKGLLSFRGFVNHELTDVGRVHFGVVYELTLRDVKLTDPDPEIAELQFVPWRSLIPAIGEFEDWSKRILAAEPRFLG